MISYLMPADRPVVDGLEHNEVVYAANQPEYIPLRTLCSSHRKRAVLSRWTLTPEQRAAVAAGDDIFLELWTFGEPLQPINISVRDDASMMAEHVAVLYGIEGPRRKASDLRDAAHVVVSGEPKDNWREQWEDRGSL